MVRQRVLSVFSLVMINVIAVASLKTLPIAASYGTSLLCYYLVLALLFFIPTALVTAELATAFPYLGGIYVWVREAFGERWGFLVVFLQWIYNIVWYPTILSFIAGTVAYVVDPPLAKNPYFMVATVLVVFWGCTVANAFGMRISSWISTIGSIIGSLIPMALIIFLGSLWLYGDRPSHIPLGWGAFFPDLSRWSNLVLMTAMVYGLIGLEMSAVHAQEVQNPKRDYPKALIWSAVIIFLSLTLSSLAIAIVVPKEELGLVSGLIQAFEVFFKSFHIEWMIPVIAVLMVIGGIGSVATWIIGPTKGVLSAAQDGLLSPYFAKTNRFGAPMAILWLQGGICTVLTLVFLLLPSVESAYWTLTALTSQLAVLMYAIIFAAAIRLRYNHGSTPRSYRIPFGNIGIWCVAGVGFLISIFVLVVGFIPPTGMDVGHIVKYEALLFTGLVVVLTFPFLTKRARPLI